MKLSLTTERPFSRVLQSVKLTCSLHEVYSAHSRDAKHEFSSIRTGSVLQGSNIEVNDSMGLADQTALQRHHLSR